MIQYLVKIRMNPTDDWGYYSPAIHWASCTKEKAKIFKSSKDARKIRDKLKGLRQGIESKVEELK